MADQPVRWTPLGNLDKDTEFKLVNKGNYTDALDIIKQDDGENVSATIQPTKRNKHAFSLGEVQAQNKKYRISLSGNSSISHSLRIVSTDRSLNIVNGSGANGEIEFNGTVASFNAEWNNAQFFASFNLSVSGNDIELELIDYPYYNWFIEINESDSLNYFCIQEAIPVDLAGPLKDIGSKDLIYDLFVLSTSQDYKPTEILPQVIFVGPISGGQQIGPLTSLTFDSNHNLQEGQWIRITNSNAPWLNGIFVVQNIVSAITIEIVTNTAFGQTYPTFTVGEERVFTNPQGLLEIGVAQKNISDNSWQYTRLLRSTELSCNTINSIDCFLEKSPKRISLYYTDNNIPPMAFYYSGEYIQDGAISYVNSENIYEYDNIFFESNLQLNTKPVKIELDQQLQTGGGLIPNIKYYVIKNITADFNEVYGSSFLGPIATYNDIVSGVGSSEPTTKKNVIRVSNLNSSVFDRFQLICIEAIDGVVVANILDEFNIPSDGSLTYTHTGFEEDNPVDVAEVLSNISDLFIESSIIRAKNIRSIDYRNVMSNISDISSLDLSDWSKSIKHTLFKDSVDAGAYQILGDYQTPENVLKNTGLMLNEIVRLSIRVFIKGVGWTNYFWIDDVKIDNNPINSANPNDNRRLGTFSDMTLTNGDFDNSANINNVTITVPDANGIPQSNEYAGKKLVDYVNQYNDSTNKFSAVQYLVPKIRFHIDWSYSVPEFSNKSLFELVSAVEFGIGDEDFSVKASGVGVASFEGKDDYFYPQGKICEFPFHPQLYMMEDQTYEISGSNNEVLFNAGFGPYIPNYPFVGRYADTSASPQFKTKTFKANERRDIISFYSPDVLLDYGDEYKSLVAEADQLIIIGGMKNQKVLGASDSSRYSGLTVTTKTSQRLGLFSWSDILIGGAMPVDVLNNGRSTSTYGYYSELHPEGPEYNTVDAINIEELAFVDDSQLGDNENDVEFGNGETFIRMDSYHNVLEDIDSGMRPEYKDLAKRIDQVVFRLSSPAPTISETNKFKQFRGMYYAQAFKDESANFKDKADTKYYKIGQTVFFEDNLLPTDIDVNGGDSITSIFFFKNRDTLFNSSENSDISPEIAGYVQVGSLMGIVSQTRKNIRLLKEISSEDVEDNNDFNFFGSQTIAGTLDFIEKSSRLFYQTYARAISFGDIDEELLNIMVTCLPQNREYISDPNGSSDPIRPKYNRFYESNFTQYDYRFPISNLKFGASQATGIVFSESNSNPNRIVYSEKNKLGTRVDYYRVFLPLSRKDLDLSFGEIEHHEDVMGELFTLQPRKFQKQIFNSRGQLQASSNAVEVFIGDGATLERDGITLSSYGTEHKWSVVKGSSSGGKDVIYWFNQEKGLFMRFGADGTVVLSERHGMRSFSANNTKWTENQHTPALNYGIRSVWDDRFKEAIWTFIGVRASKGEWGTLPSNQLYADGDTVTNNTFINYPFDGVPDVYVSLSLHYPTPQSEPGVGSDWETYWRRVDRDDPEYYTVFTLAFNELSNGFSTFYSHIPKTYLKWKNKFLSSHPTQRSEIYEHRDGYDKWYEYEGVWKESEPYIEGVVNPFPDQSKKFVAIQSLSDNVPDRIEFKTKDHESFLVSSDFDPEDDTWRSPVKNDTLTSQTGDPNDDTESLVGSYMRVKFKFFNGAYNKLNNLIVKVRQRLRRTQS